MLYRASTSGNPPRKGIVLVAVLVVVTVLSLAAYQYSELMQAEFRAADSNTRKAQTKAAAVSGVYYTMACLSDSTFVSGTLNNNPFNNPTVFQDVLVQDGDGPKRRLHFSVIALLDPDDPSQQTTAFRFGVADEASKLNVNALLQYDKAPGSPTAQATLAQLPNMTTEIAASILDWVDGSSTTPRSGGAKDEYYSGLQPAYHVKNGPLDSMDEMLLIQGVTSDLLWGNDVNRNGSLDNGEVGGNGSGGVDLGLQAYLTLYSRESNLTSSGSPRIYINDQSLSWLSSQLNTVLGPDLTSFIMAYRMYGGSSTSTSSGSSGSSSGATSSTPATPTPPPVYKPLSGSQQSAVATQITTDLNKMSSGSSSIKLTAISSLYSLITATVKVTIGTGQNAQTITMPSPLSDPGQQVTLLPLLLDNCTTSQKVDLAPRLNVNTASQTVLTALQGTNGPLLQPSDVQSIVSNQPQYTAGNSVEASTYNTPAWLITQAKLSPTTVQALDLYITARSTVYRFQVIGYFEEGGQMTRVEAVVDTNYGRPRILYLRDLTDLGPAFDLSQIRNQ